MAFAGAGSHCGNALLQSPWNAEAQLFWHRGKCKLTRAEITVSLPFPLASHCGKPSVKDTGRRCSEKGAWKSLPDS